LNAVLEVQNMLSLAIQDCQSKFPSFEEAYGSYVGQYGDSAVKVYDPTMISGTIDPVIVILGRNTPLLYRDSSKSLEGSLGARRLNPGAFYILGRRESLDSKLILWGPDGETEITVYDNRIQVVPSRIHAAIWVNRRNAAYFADLGSSSGSMVAGETRKPEPFIVAYATPRVDIRRIEIPSKYAR
jgi:hypothetical protein